MKIFENKLILISLLVLFPIQQPASFGQQLIADSIRDFSDTQGANNWFYGFYSGPFTPDGFTQMNAFDGSNWAVDLSAPSPFFWTRLSVNDGHPNGTITSGGRDPVEQWPVRRYVNQVEGRVRITMAIGDPIGGSTGNGVVGRVFVSNREVFTVAVPPQARVQTYSFCEDVSQDDTFDFAIDPNASDDRGDTTEFSIVIDDLTTVLFGDVNGDGVVSLLDVQPFVELLTNGGYVLQADFNCDNVVDLLDVAPLINALAGS